MKKNLKYFTFFLFLGGIIAVFFPLFFSLADEVNTSAEVTVLAAPANLTATAISTTQIDLSWSAVSGAASYKVYREGILIASPTANSYSDTGLSPNTTYSYTVSAVNIYGAESSESSSVSATTLSAPGGGGMPSQWYNPPAPPAEGFTILINNGNEYTNNSIVILTLRGGSDTSRMAISNNPEFTGSGSTGQIPYQPSYQWNLCQGRDSCPEGEYTVYVKFYTSWGTASEILSDSIIYRKEVAPPIEIIEKISEEAKEISEKIGEVAKKITELFKPKPPEIKPPEIPAEELVPKETPLAFKGQWSLLTYTLENKPFVKFTLAPLPKEFQKLAEKFPELEKTFIEVGIQKLIDIEKLRQVKLTLPGLTERLGLPTVKIEPGKFVLPQGVPVAKLSTEAKAKIPTEIVFAKTGGELIDLNVALSITEKGKVEQRITTVSGKPLQLVVKPDQPVKSVKGYLVFKSKRKELGIKSQELSLNSLLASMFFASPSFAKEYNPVEIEERLVLLEFEYTDPDGDGIYTAEIKSPVVEGEYEIITVMDYEDPALGQKEIRLIAVVDPEGYVYEKIKNQELRIAGAVVSLYWLNPETKKYQLWPAKEYQQENPQVTDVTGKYAFLVPEGTYYLKVEAPGYPIYEGKPFQIKEGSGVHFNIELKTKYWWLKVLDLKTILLILVILLLLYNFYRDKMRERKLRNI